ncbi:Rieske 2Fe-2S domain-containing protein [Deinococcus detaillensis]|uniref:Rieske 2Fe-2S domain-containing protein n=1 Tax=Deinococcus detaillensis TaxID=2592048 RepID=A0A553UJG1_9DEIO|nr:Rieske 2Fe-2S domain-containing protein [Deinococcus detaillensis]TSA80354.1 Rieske 2Fe-2S domain-containing protein [Deinococcus detaillensis]
MFKSSQTDQRQEADLGRRDALRVIGCLLCAAAVPGVSSKAQAQSLGAPLNILRPSEALAADGFKLMSVAGDPAILYASKTPVADGVQRGQVWLTVYSRICSHRSTVVIDPPRNQVMTCPKHHQAYDLATGQPTGYVHRTSDPLAQYSLQVRPDQSVWITGMIRPQAG